MKRMMNVVAAFTMPVLFAAMAFPATAFAQDGAQIDPHKGMTMLAGALAIGLAGLGAALGQGRAAASALEGVSRNPNAGGQIQTQLILSLALMEAIAIYGFVFAMVAIFT